MCKNSIPGIHSGALTHGKNSEPRSYFQEKDTTCCVCVWHLKVVRKKNAQARSLREDSIKLRPCVQLWNSYSAAATESSRTFSVSAGGTHYCQAHAVSSLHLLYSKHVPPELLDGVWCSKTSEFNHKLQISPSKNIVLPALDRILFVRINHEVLPQQRSVYNLCEL